MQARTFYSGNLGDAFEMSTGVRQGSIEGPTLWNIFYAFVIFDWEKRCTEKFGQRSGVQFSYTLDGKLRTGSQSERASQHIANVHDIEYADDLCIFETDFERFVESAQILDDTCRRWGA